MPHRHLLLPIAVSAEVSSSYLLQLENSHSFGMALRFLSDSYLNRSDQRVSLILGFFFGLVGLPAVIPALCALSLRDLAYGFYAASVALMGLTQAAATGIGGLCLLPNGPAWNDMSNSALPTLELTATLMFASAAVSLPERSARLHRLFIGIARLAW